MTKYKILDSAMGSELIKRGIDLPKHTWSASANLNQSEIVYQIHKENIMAGADFLTTNTFRSTPRAYSKIKSIKNIYTAKSSLTKAVEIAKSAAKSSTKILGSIAPLEDCYHPKLFPGRKVAISEFKEISTWLADSGVDIILLETMNSIDETEAALSAAKCHKLPIWVSFIIKGENLLLSGEKLTDAFNLLNNYNINMLLLNCSSLIYTRKAVNNIVNNWQGNWGIYPNLGKGKLSPDGNISNYETLDEYIDLIKYSIKLGASVVGGCCGSSPLHISTIKNLCL